MIKYYIKYINYGRFLVINYFSSININIFNKSFINYENNYIGLYMLPYFILRSFKGLLFLIYYILLITKGYKIILLFNNRFNNLLND